MKLNIDAGGLGSRTENLFGIFFEDLNHAADGGLYGELVRNRSFEFCPVDNKDYHSLTAWETTGDHAVICIEDKNPLNPNNTHYATVTTDGSEPAGIKNQGYNNGIPIRANETYLFSCFARNERSEEKELAISLEDPNGKIYARSTIRVRGTEWEKYETDFTPASADFSGRLVIKSAKEGTFFLDMISLFPGNTYKNRKNGLRRDIAEMLETMKPKFMRFPGGCLVHDGTLDPGDRGSMYRWKNTIGPVENRPARRNNWGYNQTLGLGFYEYFLFCEDIGAKPLPVLPAGWDPHHKRAEPLETLRPWIDDALDLIEFANGGADTVWGAKRAELGHPEPFGLEYIAIGNEEVGDEFFERYPLFHRAIKQKYPEIKIINSAGPFAAGTEYEKGWASARKNGSDFVDEHYYQSPEWFVANYHRYDSFKAGDPQVFLGEYASWGNTWYNALVEAAYMTGLERNAHAVGLACYAPLLCNVDYVNWRPDLIWFDNHRVYGTANYYVQKLFMNHQGSRLLPVAIEDTPPVETFPPKSVAGEIRLENSKSGVHFYDISLVDEGMDEANRILPDHVKLAGENRNELLCEITAPAYTLRLKAKEFGDSDRVSGRGFRINFGWADEQNFLYWEIGGWQNQDSMIGSRINGRGSCLSHSLFTVEPAREYDLCLSIRGRIIECYIDGVLVNRAEDKLSVPMPLYYSASLDEETGCVIVKCVNIKEQDIDVEIGFEKCEKPPGTIKVFQLAGFRKEDQNSFENPKIIEPKEFEILGSPVSLKYKLPKESLTIFRWSARPGVADGGKFYV
jgi:alpha-L-arabinofuranosidase